MIANWILVVLTLMASGYSLSHMCILRKLNRDPRPAAAAMFVLLATGIVQLALAISEPVYMWRLVVDYATVLLIWWLVTMSAIHFRRKN